MIADNEEAIRATIQWYRLGLKDLEAALERHKLSLAYWERELAELAATKANSREPVG